MKTTLKQIKSKNPCQVGWELLLKGLGKTEADDEVLPIAKIIENNGIRDAIWALRSVEGRDREIRLFAVWCARQVQHLMKDERSLKALEVAERFANGEASAAASAAASAREAQRIELLRVCAEIEAGRDPYPKTKGTTSK